MVLKQIMDITGAEAKSIQLWGANGITFESEREGAPNNLVCWYEMGKRRARVGGALNQRVYNREIEYKIPVLWKPKVERHNFSLRLMQNKQRILIVWSQVIDLHSRLLCCTKTQ